ncbi:Nitrate/nitrite transporter NarK [Jatrophihabitans endophyticus]|uniref:Lysosomal dipeptide transporter MFSD1 n=1 Tax=Jatrophihabitans endophyticus TaxID=1206085 RepID=A0A1M5CDE9_9ACTN|nr:MFS transporter [Jatrophihabitans endophyticus]SHF52696.1 Nitrate/nitrite transporter NarK [Jatrophihabitans endophyticus]
MSSSRAAVAGWALAACVYLLAQLHRTSLGVAGLLAEQRFGIDAGQLSLFVFLQIGVYAAMQIPTGVLVDRYGPRRVLVAAATIMGGAQLVFALVPLYPVALLARAALGFGDALTFVSVLRFAATHFSPRRYPVLVALTGMTGTVGNVAATLPLALLLRHVGWAPSFLGAGALSLVAGGAVALLLPDSTPPPRAVRTAAELRSGVLSIRGRVRRAWALPGTRLGFWTHFTSMSTGTALAVLWGTPYLVTAVGFSTAGAGAVLMVGVIAAAVVSPVLGWLIGERPSVRVPIGFGLSIVVVLGLVLLVTAFGDTPPAGPVVVFFVLAALGGPVSMAAFALARDYNHARSLGTASGVVNVGGFVATVLIALGIGWVLDLQGGTTARSLRWALLVAVAVQGFGVVRMIVWWLRVRATALHRQQRGEPVPVSVVRRRFDLRVTGPTGESGPGD